MPLVNATRGGVTADGLLRAARAAHALDQTRTANSLYRDAVGRAEERPGGEHGVGHALLREAPAGRGREVVPHRRPGRRQLGAGPDRPRARAGGRRPGGRRRGRRRAPSRSIPRSSMRTCSSPKPRSTRTSRPTRRRPSTASSPSTREARRRTRCWRPSPGSPGGRRSTKPRSPGRSPSTRRAATPTAPSPPTRPASTASTRPWRSGAEPSRSSRRTCRPTPTSA